MMRLLIMLSLGLSFSMQAMFWQGTTQEYECAICLTTLPGNPPADVIILRCNHGYHASCLNALMIHRRGVAHCPLCRDSLRSSNNDGSRLYDKVTLDIPPSRRSTGCLGFGIVGYIISKVCDANRSRDFTMTPTEEIHL